MIPKQHNRKNSISSVYPVYQNFPGRLSVAYILLKSRCLLVNFLYHLTNAPTSHNQINLMPSTGSSFQNLREVLSTLYNRIRSKFSNSLISRHSHPKRPKPDIHVNSMLLNSPPIPQYHPVNYKYSFLQDLTISSVSTWIFLPASPRSGISLITTRIPAQAKYRMPQKIPSGFSIVPA